mgnify:CR=1 FL=1
MLHIELCKAPKKNPCYHIDILYPGLYSLYNVHCTAEPEPKLFFAPPPLIICTTREQFICNFPLFRSEIKLTPILKLHIRNFIENNRFHSFLYFLLGKYYWLKWRILLSFNCWIHYFQVYFNLIKYDLMNYQE